MPEDKIADICRRYRIREMSVFGSSVRGEVGPESDVDVMVDLQPDAHLGWEFFDIAVELEGLLGRHVDLGTRDSLKAVARASVMREAVVVYAA
jgi:predicted nucleotidyltransferase